MKISAYICIGMVMTAVTLLTAGVAGAENIDPDEVGAQYAWGENVGWLNAEPEGQGGPGLTVTAGAVTGFAWAENIGWISFSCENTASCGSVDFGATHDGSGRLGGYAWAENVGWISLSCENTGSCAVVEYGVNIDALTGQFYGHAWSENVGWIAFDAVPMIHDGVVTAWTAGSCDGDADGDGDVDGKDLHAYAVGGSFGDLGGFSGDFGKTVCE